MTPIEQLKIIVEGRIWQAVEDHLHGDWARRNELFTISQVVFDAWADCIELPYGRVHKEPQTWDGVYVLQERDHWTVFVQERGLLVQDCGDFRDYKLAKRKALATEYLYGITLRAA